MIFLVAFQASLSQWRIKGLPLGLMTRRYCFYTFAAFGYICLSATIASYSRTGDLLYVFINFSIFLTVFSYLILPFWKNHDCAPIVNCIVGFSLASATVTLAQAINYSSLPFVPGYIQFAATLNEENPLSANFIVDGELKAFGLFSDAFVNGYVMSMGLTLLLGKWFFQKGARALSLFPQVGLLLLGIYFTLTRNCYLAVLVSIASFFLLKIEYVRKFGRSSPRLYVVGWLALGFFIMIASIYYVATQSGFDLENTVSSRVYSWSVVFNKYLLEGEWLGVSLGYGVFQWGGAYQDTDLWALDNLYVQIFMCSGLVGLVIFLCWWVVISATVLKVALLREDYFSISTFVLFVQFVIVGVYNSNLYLAPIVPLILIFGFLVFSVEDRRMQIHIRR